jgi:polysaccharide biosynthesis/export protein
MALIISGCASSNYEQAATQNQAAVALQPTGKSSQAGSAMTEDASSAELESLWRQRTSDSGSASSSEFTLGPGDVLRISVPMISQLTDRTVRVSEDDTIALPMLGEIKVRGMTEQDLRQELVGRLSRYMYQPQVEVYLQTPENRVVSVLGSIKAPGRYIVASRADTIMTLLSRAGGTTDTAGAQILLFPAPTTTPGVASSARRNAAAADASLAPAAYQLAKGNDTILDERADSRPPSLESDVLHDNSRGAPLVVSLAGPERYMEMPVHPGDVLFVPAAGSVSVQGWVEKPGLFAVTSGMTALGSVAAAGGALFSSSATLIRAEQDDSHREIALNLSKIKAGQEPDVRVRGGDVIVVERTVAGAVPYSLYFLINKIGVGVPIIP